MAVYVCQVCGYAYDEDQGEINQGVKPGTKFEDLPDTFVCPICGADKSAFAEN